MKKIPKRIHFSTPIIGSSIPQGLDIEELFVCIWPQQVNIAERVDLIVVCDEENEKGIQVKFHDPPAREQTLLFDKKADFLRVNQEPLLGVSKGGFFKCRSCEKDTTLFVGDYKKQQKFKEMLCKIALSPNTMEKLDDYLKETFSAINYKQSYSFAVYVKADFTFEEDCYFIDRQLLPTPDLPVYGVMAFVPAKKSPPKKGTKVWNPKWVEDIGEEHNIEIVEDYNEETFNKMLDITIEKFLTPMLQASSSSSYVKDVLDAENLPSDSETCQKVLDRLLGFILAKGSESEH
ncbi:hypothetical protein [Candidatus Uabimicrobium amorphum]|uniref:Uncharacterized protein n=1 Tax=Uabimicrobium amorphum TaxID=2596890 RepID=A0A5S9IS10_UABAM|nr:hypothetical protein [Candidatus Uabimicrobium amorphum]BBM86100.1 hypothetical protein UABAM_04486 [Candidatus Uabimicrobium amorphum]